MFIIILSLLVILSSSKPFLRSVEAVSINSLIRKEVQKLYKPYPPNCSNIGKYLTSDIALIKDIMKKTEINTFQMKYLIPNEIFQKMRAVFNTNFNSQSFFSQKHSAGTNFEEYIVIIIDKGDSFQFAINKASVHLKNFVSNGMLCNDRVKRVGIRPRNGNFSRNRIGNFAGGRGGIKIRSGGAYSRIIRARPFISHRPRGIPNVRVYDVQNDVKTALEAFAYQKLIEWNNNKLID